MGSSNYIPALRYDRLTPLYDLVVSCTVRERRFKSALVSQMTLRPGKQILDLACGTGTLAVLLKRAMPDAAVIGLDGDKTILEIARGKVRAKGIEIMFHRGLSYEMPYADAAFDQVVSSLFFHHLTPANKSATLAEIERVLRPGGELHIADWGIPANRLMKASSRFVQMLDGVETTRDCFAGELPTLMQANGFAEVGETACFNTIFGTIRLHRGRKPLVCDSP